MKLSQLKNDAKGIIIKVSGHGAFRKRIIEMGFVKGKEVKVIKNAPLQDPVEYSIMGYNVSLRRSEARLIEVITLEEAEKLQIQEFEGTITNDLLRSTASIKGKIIKVAFVGNPNAGKTTIFNYASGSKEHVGNYAGVTVDAKKATFKQNGYTFEIIDLPGTYSLSTYSPEELYVRKYILAEHPDIIVNVIDASNLERNLYLTTQLIDMDVKMVIALNMYDELEGKGDKFDYQALGCMIGIPFVPTVGSKKKGIKELFDKIIDVYEDRESIVRSIFINYGKIVEESILLISKEILKNRGLADRISPRFLAIKLLEKDENTEFSISAYSNFKEIITTTEKERNRIFHLLDESSEVVITDSKYGFISGALKETYTFGLNDQRKTTELIDAFVTHKLWGFPIFIFFMWLMFQTTFTLGQYPVAMIETGVKLVSDLVDFLMPSGMLKDLIIGGIIGGVGGVIIFLPNILILFLFISFMEDTGYMARAAFIMDKIMHKIGLHGGSFIPLIMGFGCNVPAIMSTRTIKNQNDRILTILINPFMSCSARLPVYVLILGAIFPRHAGNILLVIYCIGIALAVVIAIIFKKTLFKSEDAPFVMELPPYRVPTFEATMLNMWNKTVQYVQKMGGIILIASIIIWALSYFPKTFSFSKSFEQQIKNTEQEYSTLIQMTASSDSVKLQTLINARNEKLNVIISKKHEKERENSYIGQLGRFIQPVLEPLGFDWKMSVSLLAGIAGKEIVVSTMGVLYHSGNNENVDDDENLKQILKKQVYTEGKHAGKKVLTPIVAISYLLFILIYFPCIAVIAGVTKEAGGKWALFMIFYTTALAWFLSFFVYQIGSFFIL